MASPRSDDELRGARRRVFDAFHAIDSPGALFEYQAALAAEIQTTEKEAFSGRDAQDAREHLFQLRHYGDALAWLLLHPYTIRQLARHPGRPAALGSQGEGFTHTLDTARTISAEGGLVLICDLTHVARVADIVICNDPERPQLIECGPEMPPKFATRGRKGRQLRRAAAVVDQLRDGIAQHPGDKAVTITLTSSSPTDFNWAAVREAATAALERGSHVARAGEGDVVLGIRADTSPSGAMDDARRLTADFGTPLMGLTSELLFESSDTAPSPISWDVDRETAFALMERDVRVIHVIDLDRFTGTTSADGRTRIVDVSSDPEEWYPFRVVHAGDEHRVSARFLERVLFGFETIESAARSILEVAALEETLGLDEFPPSGDTREVMHPTAEPGNQEITDAASREPYYIVMPPQRRLRRSSMTDDS